MIDKDRGRWTVQRWFASVLAAMVVLIAAGTVVGANFLSRTAQVSNRLNDRISPARTAVAQLSAALISQQDGVRGYLLTGRTEFLDPYLQGVADERAATATVRGLLSAEAAALADLDAVGRGAERWRSTVAAPLIESRRGDRAPSAPAVATLVRQSRTAFDAVRERVTALESRLVSLGRAARQDLQSSRQLRDAVFAGLVGALLLLIALVAVLLRVVVLRPLARLGTAVRRVADGDFEHRPAPGGPADLAALGRDVEAMRRRLVDGLAASRRTSEQLEQQRAELHRSNADLEQFAYVASHDLQEPLRKVASFCQLLQRRYGEVLDERAQQYIAFAVDGATRMQQLINDLLAFSRIGRLYDASRPVDLTAVVDQVEQTLGLSIEESGARIDRPDLPTVAGDLTLLTMLWQNLISNAVKFRRPDRPPLIRITAERTGPWWTFGVEDNGIGIDPQYAEKIFVIFQRLHQRDAYDGTGIGLALCKKIVEHHRGGIRLDEAYRDGARFEFTLPVPAAEQ